MIARCNSAPRSVLQARSPRGRDFAVLVDGSRHPFTRTDSLGDSTIEVGVPAGTSTVVIQGTEHGPRPPTLFEEALHLGAELRSMFGRSR